MNRNATPAKRRSRDHQKYAVHARTRTTQLVLRYPGICITCIILTYIELYICDLIDYSEHGFILLSDIVPIGVKHLVSQTMDNDRSKNRERNTFWSNMSAVPSPVHVKTLIQLSNRWIIIKLQIFTNLPK